MSIPVRRLVLVFFLTNAAYAPYQFYFTDFFGKDVYEYVTVIQMNQRCWCLP